MAIAWSMAWWRRGHSAGGRGGAGSCAASSVVQRRRMPYSATTSGRAEPTSNRSRAWVRESSSGGGSSTPVRTSPTYSARSSMNWGRWSSKTGRSRLRAAPTERTWRSQWSRISSRRSRKKSASRLGSLARPGSLIRSNLGTHQTLRLPREVVRPCSRLAERARIIGEQLAGVRVPSRAYPALARRQRASLHQPLQPEPHDLLRLLAGQEIVLQPQQLARAGKVLAQALPGRALLVELAAHGGGNAALLEGNPQLADAARQIALAGLAGKIQRRARHQRNRRGGDHPRDPLHQQRGHLLGAGSTLLVSERGDAAGLGKIGEAHPPAGGGRRGGRAPAAARGGA